MFRVAIIWIGLTFQFPITLSVTNSCDTFVDKDTYGERAYCNSNPLEYSIPSLNNNDTEIIDSMRQLQIFTRHGARVITSPFSDVFNTTLVEACDMEFKCDFTTLTNRYNRQINNNFSDLFTFRKEFVNDEQVVNGNCEEGQSLTKLYQQHTDNGLKIYNQYINNSNSKLNVFDNNQLCSILCSQNNSYVNGDNTILNSSDFIIHSTNYERTIASAISLVTSIFNNMNMNDNCTCFDEYTFDDNYMYNSSSNSNKAWNILTHDITSTPYLPQSNYVLEEKLTEYDKYILKTSEYYSYWNSLNSSKHTYMKQTGKSMGQSAGISLLPIYCNNIRIPLNITVFNATVDAGYRLKELKWSNEYNMYNKTYNDSDEYKDKNTLFEILSSPFRYLINSYIDDIHNDGNNKIVYHSIHDISIFILLGGLGVGDGIQPMFAELLTLEIYSINNTYDIDINDSFPSGFGFRLIRNNDILQFEKCNQTIEMGFTICDLNVIVDILNKSAMPIKEWENEAYKQLDTLNAALPTGAPSMAPTQSPTAACNENKWYRMSQVWIAFVIGIVTALSITLISFVVFRKCLG